MCGKDGRKTFLRGLEWKIFLLETSQSRLNGNSHMENYLMHPADHVQNKIFMETIFHFLPDFLGFFELFVSTEAIGGVHSKIIFTT